VLRARTGIATQRPLRVSFENGKATTTFEEITSTVKRTMSVNKANGLQLFVGEDISDHAKLLFVCDQDSWADAFEITLDAAKTLVPPTRTIYVLEVLPCNAESLRATSKPVETPTAVRCCHRSNARTQHARGTHVARTRHAHAARTRGTHTARMCVRREPARREPPHLLAVGIERRRVRRRVHQVDAHRARGGSVQGAPLLSHTAHLFTSPLMHTPCARTMSLCSAEVGWGVMWVLRHRA
jgi:hypothetical protein